MPTGQYATVPFPAFESADAFLSHALLLIGGSPKLMAMKRRCSTGDGSKIFQGVARRPGPCLSVVSNESHR
jgi:hypothetical protein